MTEGWIDVGIIPRGPKGDRYTITALRDAPNSVTLLYRERETYSALTDTYTASGEVEQFATLYDGWVHVGFYMPYSNDNGNGTVEFFRQWYCRESAESNVFNPEGLPESMGVVTLPPGPAGGYYQITTTNPALDVTYFWAEYHYWDAAANGGAGGFVGDGNVYQIGGVEAEQGVQGVQGVQGEKGDYYRITADEPLPGGNEIIFYRELLDGVTGASISPPEQIGQVVAAQGAQGPQGIQGEPGPAGSSAYYEPILEDEFYIWGFVWYQLMKARAAINLRYYAQVGLANDIVMSLGQALVAAKLKGNEAIDFPDPLGYTISNMVAPLQSDQTIRDAARYAYCEFMPYRDMSNASLQAFKNIYGAGYWTDYATAGEWDKYLTWYMAWDMAQYPERTRQAVGIIKANVYYDPLTDYTSMPCTPTLGTWQKVWDFTINDGGWVVSLLAGENPGVYVPGVGWSAENYRTNDYALGIQTGWDGGEVGYIEVLYDLSATDSGGAIAARRVDQGFVYDTVHQGANVVWNKTNAPPVAIQADPALHYQLFINGNIRGANLIVKRISMTGEGAAPP